MNRRERRYGRMYLLPLLLGLTGMALLVLEWGLHITGFNEFGELDAAMKRTVVIVAYPLLLMLLYAVRIPPKAARVAALVSLAVALFHVAVVLYCGKHSPTPLCLKVPGYELMGHVKALQANKSARNVLLTCSDAAFVLSSISAVFTCLIYSLVKASSERRNAAFAQRNAYLINTAPAAAAAAPEAQTEEAPPRKVIEPPVVTDEPTRVLELPPEEFRN